MGANFGSGRAYDYAYLYPGIQKVVQAAGRVIRTTSDQGVVYLIDDRFTQIKVQALFPVWWEVRRWRPQQPLPTLDPRALHRNEEARARLEHAEKHQDQDDADGNTE